MANAIWHSHVEGDTLYAIIRRQTDDQVYVADTGSNTFEVWNDANLGTYDIPLADNDGNYHSVDFPSDISAGVYYVIIFKQADANPADGDVGMAQGVMCWDGSAERTLSTLTTEINANETKLDDIPTVAEFNARTLVAASYFDPSDDAVANVTLVTTTTVVTNDVGITQAAADKVWGTAARTLTSFGTLVTDIWHHLLSAITTAGTIGKLIKDYLDAAITSRAPVNEYDTEMARITANVATEAKQDTAQTDLDLLTGADGAILASSQPNYAPNMVVPDIAGTAATPAEVATALSSIFLDKLISAAVADEVVNDSIIAKLVSKDAIADWSDYSWQTESLEALKDGTLASIEADTNELQTDDYPTGIAAIKAETALIVADTNELQTDDIPGKIATVQADLDIITGTSGVLIDTDAVDADAIKTDAVTEIQSGLATEDKQDIIDENIDQILIDLNKTNNVYDDRSGAAGEESITSTGRLVQAGDC